MSDPVKAIARTLACRCAPYVASRLQHGESHGWTSPLFNGARHRIELSLEGPRTDDAIDLLLHQVTEQDFSIPGHLLADIGVIGIDRRGDKPTVALRATTIET